MSNALTTLTSNLAKQFNMGDGTDLANTLKATCFKGSTQVTDAQMTALLVVAQQYGLNPFTKELFAFPDKGGIVPVVGVDGWARIINTHQQFDGMDFDQDADSCTCTIYRKDRSHPTKVTEWMAECKRNAGPWISHPYRMLRHKSMIQCARLAFGFVGIYEQDEAERILESTAAQPKRIDQDTGEITPQKPAERPALNVWPDEAFSAQVPRWSKAVSAGLKSVDDILTLARSKGTLTAEQEKVIRTFKKMPEDVTDVQPKREPAMSQADQAAHNEFVAEMGED
jgi:phage recombination protein Bet